MQTERPIMADLMMTILVKVGAQVATSLAKVLSAPAERPEPKGPERLTAMADEFQAAASELRACATAMDTLADKLRRGEVAGR